MNSVTRHRFITRILVASVCLVWGYIGVRIWSVAATRPSPVAEMTVKVDVAESRHIQSGSDMFVGYFRDPFLKYAVDSSSSLVPSDIAPAPNQASTDTISVRSSVRFRLIGLVSATAIIQSADGHPILATVGDSLGAYRINSIDTDHLVLGSTDVQFDLYLHGESVDFNLATNQKHNP